jgi:hypothetical protein
MTQIISIKEESIYVLLSAIIYFLLETVVICQMKMKTFTKEAVKLESLISPDQFALGATRQ